MTLFLYFMCVFSYFMWEMNMNLILMKYECETRGKQHFIMCFLIVFLIFLMQNKTNMIGFLLLCMNVIISCDRFVKNFDEIISHQHSKHMDSHSIRTNYIILIWCNRKFMERTYNIDFYILHDLIYHFSIMSRPIICTLSFFFFFFSWWKSILVCTIPWQDDKWEWNKAQLS